MFERRWQRRQRYTAIGTRGATYCGGDAFLRAQHMDLEGQAYFSYLVDELPRYLRVFGIVPRRENTLIAGNSMVAMGHEGSFDLSER